MFWAIGALTVVFFVIMMVAVHTTPQAPTRRESDTDDVVEYRVSNHRNGDNN